ncbi:unnamed protein product, partial [Mesorhabditis spiculigera]
MSDGRSWRGVYEEFLWTLFEDAHSIIAEILRLADEIPAALRDPAKSRFRMVLADFSYFEKSDHFEAGFRGNKELDDLFYDEHEEQLGRFEQLFNAIANFIRGFQDDDRTNVEFLVDLLRARTAAGDTLFKRVKLNANFVRDAIRVFDSGMFQTSSNSLGRLRTRAPQVLCGCLFFAPSILNDAQLMRKLIDNYFREQWVISLGMGTVVNLFDEWASYKGAQAALAANMDVIRAKEVAGNKLKSLRAVELPQGQIGAEKLKPCIGLIAQYNAQLRWLVLHSGKFLKGEQKWGLGKKALSYAIAVQTATQFQLRALRATLRIANFEIEFFKTYHEYLGQKDESIRRLTASACEMLGEIAAVFSQGFASLRVEKKTKLHDWLLVLQKTLADAQPKTPGEGAELAKHVKRRIVQVGEMLDLGGNLAMAQYLEKIGVELDALAAAHQVSPGELRRAETSACSAYAWAIVDTWSPQVEKLLVESSNSATVRALFHKLSLAVTNLSNDLHTEERRKMIADAYSAQLEKRLRKIVQSVPRHLFVLLRDNVAALLETEWPAQILKEEAKEMADFESNFKLAEATSTISNMSVGISRMSLTRVGTLEVRPRELLTEGIRAELRARLPEVMVVKESGLRSCLSYLTKALHSLHTSFLYLCEHIDVAGHEMWRNELTGCLQRMAEEEMTSLIAQESLKGKNGRSTTLNPTTALGITTQMLLSASSPSTTRYCEAEMSWRELKSNREMLTSNEANGIESILSNLPTFALDETFFKSKIFDVLQKATAAQTGMHADLAKVGQCVLLRTLLGQSRREGATLRTPALAAALESANRSALSTPEAFPEAALELLCDLLRGNAHVRPALTKFQGIKIPTHTALVLFSTCLGLSQRFQTGSKLCPASLLAGFQAFAHQFGLELEVLAIARLFNDSIRTAQPLAKLPAHYVNILSTVEGVLE